MQDTQISNYENLVGKIIKEKNKIFVSFLEIGEICLEAKKALGNEKWEEWLNDGRVNIQLSQARKYIAVYSALYMKTGRRYFRIHYYLQFRTSVEDKNCP